MPELELCCKCDEPTGRAGKGEDSLFLENGEGPFCDICYDERERTMSEDNQPIALVNNSNPLGLGIGDVVELHGERLFTTDDNGDKIAVFHNFRKAHEYHIVGVRTIHNSRSRQADMIAAINRTIAVYGFFTVYECKKHITDKGVRLAFPEDMKLVTERVPC